MKKKERNTIIISAIWYERFLECSRTYGTPTFTSSVWRFYRSLLNINNENLNIKTQVSEYIKNTWRPNVNRIAQRRLTTDNISTNDDNNIALYTDEVVNERIVEIFEFIIQAIQDSGIGWHTFDTDGDAWDYDDI